MRLREAVSPNSERCRVSQADIIVDNLNIYREDDQSLSPMFSSPEFRSPTIINLTHFIRGNQFILGWIYSWLSETTFQSFIVGYIIYLPSTDIRIGEDYLLMAECLAKGAKCVTCPQSGYRYTVRANSISHRLNLDAVQQIENADCYFLSK